MATGTNELSRFKREINLSEYAASIGYVRDQTKSSASSVSMRHPTGDKIVISRKNGYWIYFSTVDTPGQPNQGTIIDFVQYTENANLGEVRKILREYLNLPKPPTIQSQNFQQTVQERVIDIAGVQSFLKQFKIVTESKYLKRRGIPISVQKNALFSGRILSGFDDAVIFPHWDEKGLCGYEIKKDGFTSFCKTGIKSLWRSHIPDITNKIVFAESGIEAISYFALFKLELEHTFFVSASGSWSPTVDDLILAIFKKYNHCQVIAAYNHDKGGEKQAKKLSVLADNAGIISFKKDFPENEGEDWNDVLIKEKST